MSGKKLTQAALTTVRIAVLLFAFVCLLYVVKDRYDTFQRNGIIMRRYISRFDEPWFEVALCFGPKIPGEVVDRYMNQTWTLFPERYQTYQAWNERANRNETYFKAEMAVDSVDAYREFFSGARYNWTDNVFGVSAQTPALLSQYLDGIRHRVSLGGEQIVDALEHTDIPFLLDYSICRNYSYKINYTRGYFDSLEHQIYVNDSTNAALFEIAWYIDLYVYPRGNFTEFPLIADHIPYRVDLRTHELLDVVGSKTEKMHDHAHNKAAHTHVNCLTWCLARGLLDNVPCIMPMQIPYIFNTSGRMPPADLSPGAVGFDQYWRELYPPSAAWPWMAEYAGKELCRSAEEFKEMFDKLSQVYFPRGASRYPLSPHCAVECPSNCDQYSVTINPSGTELVPRKRSKRDSEDQLTEHETVHSVTFYHSTTLKVSKEDWIYSAWEFFIDVSGMASFVMGLSIIAIHDWGFALVQWAMQMIGLEEEDEEEEELPVEAETHSLPTMTVQPPSMELKPVSSGPDRASTGNHLTVDY